MIKLIVSFVQLSFLLLSSSILLIGCNPRVDNVKTGFLNLNQYDPNLSGDGKSLALIVDQNGRPTIQLREVVSGNLLSLRYLSRNQPHSSPSLSWSGRYVAVITQRRNRRIVVIEDRVQGKLHQISLPHAISPIRISLSSDARQIAIQVFDKGKKRVMLFALKSIIEPDIIGFL